MTIYYHPIQDRLLIKLNELLYVYKEEGITLYAAVYDINELELIGLL